MPDTRELAALRFLNTLNVRLREARELQKALWHTVRDARDLFGASAACLAVLQPGNPHAELLFTLPKDASWDRADLTRFIRHPRWTVPRALVLGSVRRHDAPWGAIALQRSSRPFDRDDERLLGHVAAALSGAVRRIDRERVAGVRNRIDRKIMEQIHPKDLFYQILDGIRSLTHYDHSSALLIREEGDTALRLVAEQIAWTKAKSRRIDLRLTVAGDVGTMLQSAQVYGFDRRGDVWQEWSGRPAAALAALLDYNREEGAAEPHVREGAMICAPLVTQDGLVGLLKIAARHPGALTAFDAELVEHFRSQAAMAIQNLHRAESLRARVLTAERKNAMADLARSVSHDVNNALGSMLPLVQQMREDLRQGTADPHVLGEDLEQIQKSLQVCRRIFGGMLSFSRAGARRTADGHVRRAIDTATAILKYGMARSGIELVVDVSDDLPPVACSQSELEQVFLNLLTNAREATPPGGRIVVSVRTVEDAVAISISDTGCGIAPEHLPRVQEPFFTTKPEGNGLGLAICRSILWEVEGSLTIASAPGTGTRVQVAVPLAVSHSQPQYS